MIPQRWQDILRRRFDRAAPEYTRLAGVQTASADRLLAEANAAGNIRGVVLDLGCGTGHLARALTALPATEQVLALDLSEGMLRVAEWSPPLAAKLCRLAADVARLPLATGSVDLLISNFALHWCLAPSALMIELHRVLRAGGSAHLVIPIEGSLGNRPDASRQGSALMPVSIWQAAAVAAGWCITHEAEETCSEFHDSPAAWLAALRAMGVTARHDTGTGLSGRRAHQELLDRLEQTRDARGIPLSYQVWRVRLDPA